MLGIQKAPSLKQTAKALKKERIVIQPSILRCDLLYSFREVVFGGLSQTLNGTGLFKLIWMVDGLWQM